MIEVRRDGSKLTLDVKLFRSMHTHYFQLDCGSVWAANLLYWAVKDQMQSRFESMRQEAYTQGWKDAKAKRTKKTHFFHWW